MTHRDTQCSSCTDTHHSHPAPGSGVQTLPEFWQPRGCELSLGSAQSRCRSFCPRVPQGRQRRHRQAPLPRTRGCARNSRRRGPTGAHPTHRELRGARRAQPGLAATGARLGAAPAPPGPAPTARRAPAAAAALPLPPGPARRGEPSPARSFRAAPGSPQGSMASSLQGCMTGSIPGSMPGCPRASSAPH